MPGPREVEEYMEALVDADKPVGVAEVVQRFYGADFNGNADQESNRRYRRILDRVQYARKKIMKERHGAWQPYKGRRGPGAKWVFEPTRGSPPMTDAGPVDVTELKAKFKEILRIHPIADNAQYLTTHPKVDFPTFARDHFGVATLPKTTGPTATAYAVLYNRFKRARDKTRG